MELVTRFGVAKSFSKKTFIIVQFVKEITTVSPVNILLFHMHEYQGSVFTSFYKPPDLVVKLLTWVSYLYPDVPLIPSNVCFLSISLDDSSF